MHNVVKWPNILEHRKILKYVWPFYNIMHERVNMNSPFNICVIFRFFDKIDSFLKNVSTALDSKKGRLYLWRTASFTHNCWLALPLWIPRENRAKLKKLFYLNSRLRWWAQYPRYTEFTSYFPISNCSNENDFLNWR